MAHVPIMYIRAVSVNALIVIQLKSDLKATLYNFGNDPWL